MTKDLALLVGPDQKWLSTTGFLDKVDENLQEGDGGLNGEAARITASGGRDAVFETMPVRGFVGRGA